MTISAACPHNLASDIRTALKRMQHCSLDYDMVDHGPTTTSFSTVDVGGVPCGRNSLVAAIDLLCYAMDKMGRKYSDLHVLSKNPRSRSSYTLKQPLRDFLGELCSVPEYKTVLTSQLNNMVQFLKTNPKYAGIRSIKVDLNLIEVSKVTRHIPPEKITASVSKVSSHIIDCNHNDLLFDIG